MGVRLITIWAAWALMAGAAQAQTVKAGIDAWQRGNPAAAAEIWRPLAEKGDADAAFNLGQAYRLGRGVPVNLAAAQVWLERAARKDHLDAQVTLGLLLFQNGNQAGGLRWLRTAAERGEARALLIYGTALFNGDGVPRDPVLAYAYVSRAAAQGLAPAQATLADMDRVLPLDQRKKGVALAIDKAKQPRIAVAAARRGKAPPAGQRGKPGIHTGTWRVQLGAFGQRAAAEALYRRLAGSAPLAGRQPFLQPAGGMVRLQVGPFASRAAAASACAVLTAKGQACFPVAGK